MPIGVPGHHPVTSPTSLPQDSKYKFPRQVQQSYDVEVHAVEFWRGRYLGPGALIGLHGRRSWSVRFGGKAYLCATEHWRGVTPDEADCLCFDERIPLDELLRAARERKLQVLTSQIGRPPPVEVPTEPPMGPEEPSRDDVDIGMDVVEQMTL